MPLEEFEFFVDVFNNGYSVKNLIKVSEEYIRDIDLFMQLSLEFKDGIVFLIEVPNNYTIENDFIPKEYFIKAKRLSTGTWFTNPSSIVYESTTGLITNKEELNRWILFNRKRFLQYAYLSRKLVKDIKLDYKGSSLII